MATKSEGSPPSWGGQCATRAGSRITCYACSAAKRRALAMIWFTSASFAKDRSAVFWVSSIIIRVSFSSGITHGLWSFLRAYIMRLGFLDGREGFLLAVANAEGTYYRYMKAWLAGRQRE